MRPFAPRISESFAKEVRRSSPFLLLFLFLLDGFLRVHMHIRALYRLVYRSNDDGDKSGWWKVTMVAGGGGGGGGMVVVAVDVSGVSTRERAELILEFRQEITAVDLPTPRLDRGP